jgi:hypothetical protein
VNFAKIQLMKKNMGRNDRTIRVIIALLVLGLYLINIISGTSAIILLGLSAIFALTSLISFCPLYLLFGINTCKKK